jgi:FkbM family methyltransferase
MKKLKKVLKVLFLKTPYIGPLLQERDSLKRQLVKIKSKQKILKLKLENTLKEKQNIESRLSKTLKEKRNVELKLEKAIQEHKELKNKIKYQKISYSQDGEDQVLFSLMNNPPEYKGFYIDIGAHHPLRFSNTQLFYEKGWHGINIDATPGSMNEFKRIRKRDINLEAGVSENGKDLEFFSFKESALNSFDRELSEQRIKEGWELLNIKKIKTYKINDILSEYLRRNQKIDFINIDVEGLDLLILESLNWNIYSAEFLLFEALDMVNSGIMDYRKTKEYKFFESKGYEIVGRSRRTLIFQRLNNNEYNGR